MICTIPCTFQFNDFNEQKQLKLMSILYQFETVGSVHSENAGDSLEDKMNEGQAWIQLAWRVHINRRPVYREKIYANTWITGHGPSLMMNRCYTLTNEQGEELVTADGVFSVYDWKSQSSIHVPQETYDIYGPEERVFYKRRLPRLKAPQDPTVCLEIPLRRSDMDYNGHVHNTYYLNLALEAIDKKDYENGSISDFTLVYHSPLKEGDTASVKVSFSEDTYQVAIYNKDAVSVLAELSRN